MKRYTLPAIAVISLLFATTWTLAERPVRKPTQPPATPPESAAADTVAAVGLVEPGTENIALSCAVSGLVTALDVKAGDRVRSGQRLFSVDDRDLRADLESGASTFSMLYFTSAEVSALPEWNFTPSRRVNV